MVEIRAPVTLLEIIPEYTVPAPVTGSEVKYVPVGGSNCAGSHGTLCKTMIPKRESSSTYRVFCADHLRGPTRLARFDPGVPLDEFALGIETDVVRVTDWPSAPGARRALTSGSIEYAGELKQAIAVIKTMKIEIRIHALTIRLDVRSLALS